MLPTSCNVYVLHEDEPAVDKTKTALEVEVPDFQSTSSRRRKKRFKPEPIEAYSSEDKDIVNFQGFYAPYWKAFLFYLVGICSAGISFLLCKWSPKVAIWLKLSRCPLGAARHVLVTLVDGRQELVDVKVVNTYDPVDPLSKHGLSADEEHPNQSLLSWQDAQREHHLLEYRCNRYFFSYSANTFVAVTGLPPPFSQQLQRTSLMLESTPNPQTLDDPDWDVTDRQMRYGTNEMCIPVKSVFAIVFDTMWHPFYVFQYFSILLWMFGTNYVTYAICIGLITWFSIITNALDCHSNMKRLAGIAYFKTEVEVLRDGEFQVLNSIMLVPGDIVVVADGVLSCDCVLMRGECIVDENMLTGESVPVRKVAYSAMSDGADYDPDKFPHCTLYGGTSVAQARAARGQKPLAVVARTRFYSAKGQLLRSILFPKEQSHNFVGDAMKFVGLMCVVCMLMYIWAAVELAKHGASGSTIALQFFDMITVAVPPALPACLTICLVFATSRLRDLGIYVTNSDRIALAGHLDVIAFDKTGTLTEQGLHLKGLSLTSDDGKLSSLVINMSTLPNSVVELMASCHGLAALGSMLVGDPLDQQLFQATGWELVDMRVQAEDDTDEEDSNHQVHTWVQRRNDPSYRLAILRRFDFTAALQRNLVLVQMPGGQVKAMCKGSPEMLRTLVQPQSLPPDFDACLSEHTQQGYRVLALAMGDASHLPEDSLNRLDQRQVEEAVSLKIVGLAVLDNPLRPDTTDAITSLHGADIRSLMVTGDHVRTAISVAHQCGILKAAEKVLLVDAAASATASVADLSQFAAANNSPVKMVVLSASGAEMPAGDVSQALSDVSSGRMGMAVTGKGFQALVEAGHQDMIHAMLAHGGVFARMNPDNKRDLVCLLGDGIEGMEYCPHLGKHVGFCGDGANDCGALKAAHVGVSLCEAEASVAAPMTSKEQSIAAMIRVVAEGRCTLMATYQVFQFIVGYALVQAFETNFLYSYNQKMGNYQYLIQDLFFTTILASLMGYTHPRAVLSKRKPLPRVLSLPLILSTIMQLLVTITFLMLAIVALQFQPGYERTVVRNNSELTVRTPENTSMYIVGLCQFLILAVVFNKGHPHRREMWTNVSLCAAIIFQAFFIMYSLFSSDVFTREVVELVDRKGVVTNGMRFTILGLVLLNGVVAYATEAIVTPAILWMINAWRTPRTTTRQPEGHWEAI